MAMMVTDNITGLDVSVWIYPNHNQFPLWFGCSQLDDEGPQPTQHGGGRLRGATPTISQKRFLLTHELTITISPQKLAGVNSNGLVVG